MEHKSILDKHIETLRNKKMISLPDLIKLNQFNKKQNNINVGEYITFQYKHTNNKNIFNKLPFILITNYSQHHVSGINLLHLNYPLRTNLFNFIEKNDDVKQLHHHLNMLSKTHYAPYFQSFSFKNFESHVLSFTKEYHDILHKLPIVPVNTSININKTNPTNNGNTTKGTVPYVNSTTTRAV